MFANSQSTSLNSSQSNLNAWFPCVSQSNQTHYPGIASRSTGATYDACISAASNVPVNGGMPMSILLEIQMHVRGLERRFDTLEESIYDLKSVKSVNAKRSEQNVKLSTKIENYPPLSMKMKFLLIH